MFVPDIYLRTTIIPLLPGLTKNKIQEKKKKKALSPVKMLVFCININVVFHVVIKYFLWNISLQLLYSFQGKLTDAMDGSHVC